MAGHHHGLTGQAGITDQPTPWLRSVDRAHTPPTFTRSCHWPHRPGLPLQPPTQRKSTCKLHRHLLRLSITCVREDHRQVTVAPRTLPQCVFLNKHQFKLSLDDSRVVFAFEATNTTCSHRVWVKNGAPNEIHTPGQALPHRGLEPPWSAHRCEGQGPHAGRAWAGAVGAVCP